MNYRHAFHAGGFADVLKHITLCRALAYLRRKPTAFRVIDTHAGAGRYDLAGTEAARGGEWRSGIGRLRDARLRPEVWTLLAPYLDSIAACNAGAALTCYPGSPALARAMLRPQDGLIACEVEPTAAVALTRTLTGDPRSKALRLDGWTALRAQVPPKERRGIVIVDPPYEQPDEFERLAHAIAAAYHKWTSGIFLLWYPIKERSGPDALAKGIRAIGTDKLLRIELSLGAPRDAARLSRCGVIIINPPWTLETELSQILPALTDCLADGAAGTFRLDRLGREK